MEKKEVVFSDSYKTSLVQNVGNDYKDFLKKIDVIQGNGITLITISKLLGINRVTLSRIINQTKRKNSTFFKHLALNSIVDRLYSDCPKKNKSKRQKKQRCINAVVVRPSTEKEVSYD